MVRPHRGLGLPLLALLLGHATATKALERYVSEPTRCTLTRTSQTHRCHQLELSQASDHSVRVRLLGSDARTGTSIRLTFVSRNANERSPLACEEKSCRLRTSAWMGQITSGSWIRFNDRGLPDGPTHAELMTGECLITHQRMICDSQTTDGLELRAEARL
ncbi:MAG: hypothetical protein ACPHAS_00905 [Synechococcus sp.]